MNESPFISSLLFFVAFLYASVGHGGASGYLAILTFFHFSPAQMATSALLFNVVVAGIAWVTYDRFGHFSFRQIAPFILGSLPFALLGGSLKIPPSLYHWLLAGCLGWAAFRLACVNGEEPDRIPVSPHPSIACLVGGAIGFISGVVGVGGGIFLSPVLLLAGWAKTKEAAAVSAFFIWVNSLAALVGRGLTAQFDSTLFLPYLIPTLLGGWIGAYLGAKSFSSRALRSLLAIVLLIAGLKTVLLSLH